METKIQNTIDALTAQSRKHFEEKLAEYQRQMRNLLIDREAQMKSQSLTPSFNFQFKVEMRYQTEAGPLFPPLPGPVQPRHDAAQAQSLRRSRRLAAKPRINYEEEELEEEKEAREAAKEEKEAVAQAKREAKEAKKAAAYAEKEAIRAAKKAAREAEKAILEAELEEARAEFHKIRDEIWKKHKGTRDDYYTSCGLFRINEVWKRPDSEEMAAHRALKAKYLEANKEFRSAPLAQAQKLMKHLATRRDQLK